MTSTIAAAGAAGVTVEVCSESGFATIKLECVWSGDALQSAVDECSRRTSECCAVLISMIKSGADSTAEALPAVATDAAAMAQVGTNDVAHMSSLDSMVEKIERMPQTVVGIVERSTTYFETCVLAACDSVLAAPGVEFDVVGDLVCGTEAISSCHVRAAPLCLARLLGPRFLEHLPSAKLHVHEAFELGVVCETFSSLEALRNRRTELCGEFKRGPMATLAAQRWAARRSARGRARALIDYSVPCEHEFPAAASAGVDEPPTKKRRLSSSIADGDDPCETIIKALLQWPEETKKTRLPEHAQLMFTHVANRSLAVHPDQRQPFQHEVVEMIAGALASIESKQQKAVEVAQAILDGADLEGTTRDATLAAAESRIVEARCVITNCKNRLRDAATALRELAKALADEEANEKLGNSTLDEQAAKRDKLEVALRTTFSSVRDGSVVGAKAKKQTTALVALGKEFDFDETMLSGLPGALNQKPDKRSAFDEQFLSAFETELQCQVALLEQALIEGEPEREQRAAVVQVARDKHEEAKRRQQDASAALQQAQTTLREEEAAIRSCAEAVQNFRPEVTHLEGDVEAARTRLAHFREGPLEAFCRLRREGWSPSNSDVKIIENLSSSASCGSTVPLEAAADEGAKDGKGQDADIGDVEDTLPTPTVVVGKEENLGDEEQEDAQLGACSEQNSIMLDVEKDAQPEEGGEQNSIMLDVEKEAQPAEGSEENPIMLAVEKEAQPEEGSEQNSTMLDVEKVEQTEEGGEHNSNMLDVEKEAQTAEGSEENPIMPDVEEDAQLEFGSEQNTIMLETEKDLGEQDAVDDEQKNEN